MISKRPLPELSSEPEPAAAIPPHHRLPGQPGYPQARAMERLRQRHVTRIRKLSRKS